MPSWLMSIIWYFAEKIGALIFKKVQEEIHESEESKKDDQYAKDVVKEMQDAKTDAQKDQADRDILSGR